MDHGNLCSKMLGFCGGKLNSTIEVEAQTTIYT
jgi:hypothetical protein